MKTAIFLIMSCVLTACGGDAYVGGDGNAEGGDVRVTPKFNTCVSVGSGDVKDCTKVEQDKE